MSQIVLNIRPTSEPRSMNAQTALGLTNGPQWQLDIEPIGKNAQIALALTNGKVACVCAHQWTYPVLELVRSASFHSTETKLKWAASAKQGRNREDPQNKSFLTAARNAPPEKAMAPHSSTLAWKIPWTAESGGLQSPNSVWCMAESQASADRGSKPP